MEKYNIFDYIKWRGDLSFNVKSFNMLDALAFTLIAFIDFSKEMETYPTTSTILMNQMYGKFMKENDISKLQLGLLLPNDIFELGKLMESSYRYSKVEASNYINSIDMKITKQFSAMTYHIDKNNIFIAFRGTDDTLIGWAEDVNMLCKYPIPAQEDALDYLNKIGEIFPNANIYIGGHSKGGNIAVFAAVYANSEIKKRIKAVYSFDGPGFYKENLDVDKFNSIKNKITHITPNSSIIGRIFHLDVNPLIVNSFSRGIDQHNPLTWEIKRDHFVKVKNYDGHSNKIKKEIDKLIESMNQEEKEDFAEDLTNFVDSLDKNHLIDFLNLVNLFSLLSNKYWMKHKNLRRLFKLYMILYKNNAIVVKIQK